jgi:hypothetical protein
MGYLSQISGSFGAGRLSDKQIAEDILSSQKYLSNYFYAPAILESSNNSVRSAFRELHNQKQDEAKQLFDFMNSRGWYNVKPADTQAINDLRNTAQQSMQSVIGGMTGTMTGNFVSSPIQQQNQFSGSQKGWTGTNYGEGQSGFGPSSLAQGVTWGGAPSIYNQAQSSSGQKDWTGTNYGEGQSGLGPSSLAQVGGQFGMSNQGQSMVGQRNLASSNYSEGQRGFGPSSLAQGVRGIGSSGISGQSQFSSSQGGWTGTNYGEGQSGSGPSSLAQGVRWGGAPSIYNQPQSNQRAWTGTNYGEGQSGFGPSSLAQGLQSQVSNSPIGTGSQMSSSGQNLGQIR